MAAQAKIGQEIFGETNILAGGSGVDSEGRKAGRRLKAKG